MTTYTAPPNQFNLNLGSGDTLTVNATGVAYNTSLGGGTLTLNGGDAVNTTLETAQFDIDAGTAVDTTVFIGGTVDLKGGSAFNTDVMDGEFDIEGGTAIGTTVGQGTLNVTGGTVTETTIETGRLTVFGGTVVDLTIGGPEAFVRLRSPADLAGTITFGGSGQYIIHFDTKFTNANVTFSKGDQFLNLTYGNDQTVSYQLKAVSVSVDRLTGNNNTLVLEVGSGTTSSPTFSPEIAGTIVYTAEFGSAPDTTELNVLNQFAQTQFAYGQKIGVMDPSIYAFQALGVALASTATNFQNTFGPAVDGDVQFLVDAYASVFGQPGSGAQIQQFSDQLNFFETLYTAAGAFGSQSNIDLLARGAVYGQMLGIEHESAPIGSEPGGTTFTAPPVQTDLVLNNGDTLNVNNNGQSFNTTINDGGIENVNQGGLSRFANIMSGGIENVSGHSDFGIVQNNGTQHVLNGGIAGKTEIRFGGKQIVDSGGTTIQTTIDHGGTEIIAQGGLAQDVIFAGDGHLELANPLQLTGTITLSAPGTAFIDFTDTPELLFTNVNYDGLLLTMTFQGNKTITYGVVGANRVVLGPNGGHGAQLALEGATAETSIVGAAPSEMHSV